jgi:hypothetical protein
VQPIDRAAAHELVESNQGGRRCRRMTSGLFIRHAYAVDDGQGQRADHVRKARILFSTHMSSICKA